ncbi:hypothetical protein [Aeoliella sp. SH292]|uniref:hypothetical protein n=1 Tax=Aeoliella sp. SH292 TaxID=3454464 RepID=UPI003F96838C
MKEYLMSIPMIRLTTLSLATLVVLVAASQEAPAAPTKAGSESLEDLGGDLLNDPLLGDLIDSASKQKAASPQEKDSASDSNEPGLQPNIDELRRLLDPPKPPAKIDGEDIGESPLVRISGRMAAAGQLIESQNATGETREVQEEIVSDLDKLIDQLNKQCQNCKSGQCNKPGQQQTQAQTPKPGTGKPSSSSSQQSGPAESKVSQGGGGEAQPGNPASQDTVKQLWGQLPERLRQQLLQSTADEFLPKYRAELEQYFRRLAEEQSSDLSRE